MTPATGFDPARLKLLYEWDAQRYLESLPLEHFMEATTQSTQRKITVESFDLIGRARPEVQCFSELLVQYALPGADLDKPLRVVPDNMVVVHEQPLGPLRSYMLPLQPARPFLVLEYVSPGNPRKDYDENYKKYEGELQVPFYLLFYPDNEELSLFRLAAERYISVLPDGAGRLAIPELELEVALLGGWVRFWFRGRLIPLPVELEEQLEAEQQARREAETRAATAETHAATAEQRADSAEQRADSERTARLAMEVELARLRELLAKPNGLQP